MGIQLRSLNWPPAPFPRKPPENPTLTYFTTWTGSLRVGRKNNRKEAAKDPWPRKGWLESIDHFINRGTFFSEVVSGRLRIFSRVTLLRISVRGKWIQMCL